MDANTLTTAIAIGVVVVVAAVTDAWKGKIYNWLTLPVLALAPCWHFAIRGTAGLLFSLEGFGVMLLVMGLMALLAGKGMWGGDLKLFAALGALGGPMFALWALLFTALSGLVLAVPVMLRKGILGYTLRNMTVNLSARHLAGAKEVSVGDGSLGGKLPYGICIAIGTLIALYHPGLRL